MRLTTCGRCQSSSKYFLVQPTEVNDPYTCSTLPLLTAGLADDGITNDPVKIDFDTAAPQPTQDSAASAICLVKGSVTIFYSARDVYLSSFLADIIEDKNNGECTPSQITVLSQSDAAQLRVPSQFNEASRREVLRSGRLDGSDAWLRIYYTPLADPSIIDSAGRAVPARLHGPDSRVQRASPSSARSRRRLGDHGLRLGRDRRHRSRGPAGRDPSPAITSSCIQSQIQDLMSSVSTHPAQGADGPIRFDR